VALMLLTRLPAGRLGEPVPTLAGRLGFPAGWRWAAWWRR
jgi:hypothetical protein